MRRSAAPSQLKRNAFTPPFKVPEAKRVCTPQISTTTLGNEAKGGNAAQPARSIADIVNLIKRPPSDPTPARDQDPELSCSSVSFSAESVDGVASTKEALLQRNIIPESEQSLESGSTARFFSVVWCKLSKKKHKKWEGDGVLIVKQRSVALKDMEAKEIARGTGYKIKDLETLEEGNTLPIGGKEIEIQGIIASKDYASGKCFQGSGGPLTEIVPSKPSFGKPKAKTPFRLPSRIDGSRYTNKENSHSGCSPLYDPSNPDHIVLPRPSSTHQWEHNSKGLPLVDVVVDPFIGSKLRPHQRTGLIFLYECVMGFRMQGYQGAILADEMGLGKTLQCIALIWTLMKQGPYGCMPILKKVLIVTPSSLTNNWGKEFGKWLNKERLQVFIVDQNKKPEDFPRQQISPIMVISYEMLVRSIERVQAMNFDLLLCDEGHRLKNSAIKTTSLLTGLNIKKRVILTGTPIQNDLQELFTLIEFVNPGVLGTSAMFKRVYEEPIVRSKQPSASEEEKEVGTDRAAELNRLISLFTLRRTQDIINKYLPPKTEFVVFCRPTPSQSRVYDCAIGSQAIRRSLLGGEAGDHLATISLLRKLCNHPALVKSKEGSEHSASELYSEIIDSFPDDIDWKTYSEEDSGKLAVVSCLLWNLADEGRERIVIVSNFTTTLDMLQQLCERYGYLFLRLDGSTPSAKRQSLVDRFNSKFCQEFVFLLSAKAGGVGLNLIGASRILLFDIDWNPATDLQAMARVWRDGQKNKVHIYRLLLSGSLEEKIFQRQVCKQGISGSVVDARLDSKVQFSTEELRDLFSFDSGAECLTHELLSCQCDRTGGVPLQKDPKSQPAQRDCQLSGGIGMKTPNNSTTTMDQLYSWQHFSTSLTSNIGDSSLEAAKDFTSFIFKCDITQEEAFMS